MVYKSHQAADIVITTHTAGAVAITHSGRVFISIISHQTADIVITRNIHICHTQVLDGGAAGPPKQTNSIGGTIDR